DIGCPELSHRRPAGSTGQMNDDFNVGGGPDEIGRDELRRDELDSVGYVISPIGPHDGPHRPAGVPEMEPDIATDESIGAGHGDPAAHWSLDALPRDGAAARLTA